MNLLSTLELKGTKIEASKTQPDQQKSWFTYRTDRSRGENIVSIIQAQGLEAKGLLNAPSSSLLIQGKCFKPGPAFTKSLRQTAIVFCAEARPQRRQYIPRTS